MDASREDAPIDQHTSREGSRGQMTHMLERGNRNPTRGAARLRGLGRTEEAMAATAVKAGTRLVALGREVMMLLPKHYLGASHAGISKD